jgi:catechol 2,3-dioxygenase-like lactoylglutathione lyase family enzyme
MAIEKISAVTLATHDMERAVAFYKALGFEPKRVSSAFATFRAGPSCFNLVRAGEDTRWAWWGRVIFHVNDVDQLYDRAIAEGLHPQAPPADASWAERFFHILDPDGHELSFARPL